MESQKNTRRILVVGLMLATALFTYIVEEVAHKAAAHQATVEQPRDKATAKVDLDAKEAHDLVFHCMDHRFCKEGFPHWIATHLEHADELSWPGPAKCFHEGEAMHDPALAAFALAQDAHHVRTVHLINHQGCGGYQKFHSGEEAKEKAFHHQDLVKAARAIQGTYPKLQVRIYFAQAVQGNCVVEELELPVTSNVVLE